MSAQARSSISIGREVCAIKISLRAFKKMHTDIFRYTLTRDDALSHARSSSSPDGRAVSAGETRVHTTKGIKEDEADEVGEGTAKASEAKEMRMENTVSGDRWWCSTERPNERSVEGRRLTYLPVVGSVGVRQVENPSVASLGLFKPA